MDVALASINHSSDVENEIRNSVRAGKVATIHDGPVAYAGGTFVGYTIIDPVTGAGAYKIGGGENGGILAGGLGLLAIGIIGIVAGFAGIAIAPMIIAVALSLALHIIVIELIFNDNVGWDDVKSQAYFMLGTVLGLIGAVINLPALATATFIGGVILGLISLLDA